ncbi:MAG: adenylate/guanylate cyclase domain-containing protein [Mariprofundus sp.]|nr:adenylate/guanylate cyclase domain-containing protein [Mariprofundus sp.]
MSYLKRVQANSYQQRLESLISERMQTGADKADIDARIWDIFGEKWSIMFTDLSGFSRYVTEFGIIHFLQNIQESQRIFEPCIEANDGILIKVEGDSLMVLFRHPSKAVKCAIAMQQATKTYNIDKIEAEKILLCVGIGYGDILTIGDQDVFGEEVNAASKLGEDTAKAWEILVTGSVIPEIKELPGISFEPLEEGPAWVAEAYKLEYPL